eukprot:TRINITY_DN529_c0_g3_i1.p1 TRINITY_DN529_c0_g3~~TRINITY_DN529_c0_g3_i1.p1  ORF type:complete len:169 (-),score=65.80 TRINITY_DN529_c0_g3_i1:125-631(-)
MSAKRERQAHKVLVCIDGTEPAHSAFTEAMGRVTDLDDVHLISAVERVHPIMVPVIGSASAGMMESASVFADANRKMEEHTKEVLRAYVALAQKDYGIECRGHVVCGENAKEMVVQYIVDHAIQDVYVGTRDVGAFKRFFLGSFSTHVSTHAPCNVVIVRHRAAEAKK